MSIMKHLAFAATMSLLCSLFAGTIPSTAYIRDGLLAQWDGIDNAGVGKHDADARVWKDLTWNYNDFRLNDGGSWESDALIVNGNSAEFAGAFSSYAYQSIEAEYEVITANESGYILDTGNNCHVLVTHDNDNKHQTWFDCTSDRPCHAISFDSATGKRHVAATYADSATGTCPSIFYKDGAAVITEQNGDWWGISGSRAVLGQNYNTSSPRLPANVRLHALRLYNRTLSATEIAFNNALDRIRFDGVAPATAFAGLAMPEGYAWDGENLTVPETKVVITVNLVRQRYPWNGLVDIDYTLEYRNGAKMNAAFDRIEFTATDNLTGKKYPMRIFQQFYQGIPLSEAAGQHRITWMAHKDGVTNNFTDVTVTGSVNTYGATYMEVDVSGGKDAECYPVTYRNGEPENGYAADEKYKTDVIVLRYIPAGTCLEGFPSDVASFLYDSRAVQHRIILSQPFWIGIFELTWQQYCNVLGGTTSSGDEPVHNVAWTTIRSSDFGGTPSSGSLLGKLRSKCRAKDPTTGEYTVKVDAFDLPTQAQWEYACRAGTTTPYNDGARILAERDALKSMQLLAVWDGNYSDDVNGIHEVGTKAPNNWGLYDMHGNVYELCSDGFVSDVQNLKQYLDPYISSGYPERRGGNWDTGYKFLTSAMRGSNSFGAANFNGFRISCAAQ